MNQDFVTQLRLQLREAALREERRAPFVQRLVRTRRGVPGPGRLAAALAVAVLALAVTIGALSLRGEPAPTKPKVLVTFQAADGLTSMTQGFGAVWASDLGRGDILRIDPQTRRTVARIPAGRAGAEGGPGGGPAEVVVAAGAGAVWALTGDLENGGRQGPVRLLRIDPRSNRIAARIPMRKPSGGTFSPQMIQISDGMVWVVGNAGALRIDPAGDTADRFVGISEPGLGIVAEGDTVWALSASGRLRQIDARTGRTVHTLRVPVTTDTHLFPASSGLLARLTGGRVTRGTRITTFDPGDGHAQWHATFEGPINYLAPGSGDTLWAYVIRAPEQPDRLVRLEAGSGRPIGQVEIHDPGVAGLAQVGRELWVAHPNGRITVVR
jgi:hypothetical protein